MTDNVTIGLILEKEKWTIEIEDEDDTKVITTDSKEELLKLIDTFELTLVD
jgi:hypothetical protein